MRTFLILLYLSAIFVACQDSQPREAPPNILMIMADDLGFADLGCYGSEIHTPHLDQLASQGMRMTQFYNTAKCTETRSILLTGLYHQQTQNLNRNDNNLTIAEVLQELGYRTILSGKWHVGDWKAETNTPNDRGFDQYFGFLTGAIDFFTGEEYSSGINYMRVNREEYEVPDDFYATDAFTDFALEQIEASVEEQKPFFLYLAHNAPHFPLQVHQDRIDQYQDEYMLGWDSLRKQRQQRMQELGIISREWKLSTRDSLTPSWQALLPDARKEEDLLMATYAGMISQLDQQIGRITSRLDDLGIADQTLVLFFSDNGGCPYDANHAPIVPPGPATSGRTYDTEWAQVSNTPFQKYKQWVHEGGISSPMIVRWPGKVPANSISHQPGQVLDIMPTLVEVAQGSYPIEFEGRQPLPMEGVSLLPIFTGDTLARTQPMFWEYRGSRAVREGPWKLVGQRGDQWELYNLDKDRSESTNLAEQHPDRVATMAEQYDRWAARVGARSNQAAEGMPINQQDRYLYPDEKRQKKAAN